MKNGFLIIDKPAGLSSFGVVNKVRFLLGKKLKVGHTGTLDPAATGVLALCIGKATKFADYFSGQDKEYQGTAKLGEQTDTLDAEGVVLEVRDYSQVTLEMVNSVFEGYRGDISQIPPMYSAVKHKGKRLYKLARQGKEVPRTPRKITIHRLEFSDYRPPFLEITVSCSKGTYIRSLVDDIGRDLGCGAHLCALRRLQSGPFSLEQAIGLEKFERLSVEDRWDKVLPLDDFLSHFPEVKLASEQARQLCQGMRVEVSDSHGNLRLGGQVRIKSSEGELIAVGIVESSLENKPSRVMLKPKTVLTRFIHKLYLPDSISEAASGQRPGKFIVKKKFSGS